MMNTDMNSVIQKEEKFAQTKNKLQRFALLENR